MAPRGLRRAAGSSADVNANGALEVAEIPVFVDAVLGLGTPLEEARSDVNCDGAADGRDVQPFVDLLLN